MKNSNSLNQRRYEIISKGFLCVTDIQHFCKCGYKKARKIYDELSTEIKNEGKRISPFGIPVIRLLNYLELDEEKIKKYAKDEMDN